MSTISRPFLARYYEAAARKYLRSLPLEHFMEATPQATQRAITLASFYVIHHHRQDIQMFNELLVQYPRQGRRLPGQVVPDNMGLMHDEPIEADGSFDVPLQPVSPFLMMEYVSKTNARKDYEDDKRKYEKELKVPYYQLFHPKKQKLTLYHHDGKKYQVVKPNDNGRLSIPEMAIEVAILAGWVRFWFQGKLVRLPDQMEKELVQKDRELEKKDRVIEQKDLVIEQKGLVIEQKDLAIEQKDRAIEQKDRAIEQKDLAIEQKDRDLEAAKMQLETKDQALHLAQQEIERLRRRPSNGHKS